MRELDRLFDIDFEAYIRSQFDAKLVEVLGIPEAGPDRGDIPPTHPVRR